MNQKRDIQEPGKENEEPVLPYTQPNQHSAKIVGM